MARLGADRRLPDYPRKIRDAPARATAYPSIMRFRFIALPPAVTATVRARRADDFGNAQLAPVIADASPGYPCRHCLRDPAVGDAMLLFSYSPFAGPAPYRTVGPVFVHADGCAAPADAGAVPAMLRTRLLAVRAYDGDDHIVAGEVVDGHAVEALLTTLLDDRRARYLLVHFARYGCYACRVEAA
jgi:hypothetical protein